MYTHGVYFLPPFSSLLFYTQVFAYMKREDKAARLIQRIFRGRLARHAMRIIRHNRAARKIQGMWRGRAGRQLYMAQLRQIRGIKLQVRVGGVSNHFRKTFILEYYVTLSGS
jgi:hypothetical protein